MARMFLISICVLQIAVCVECSGFYSVIAPGTLRSKSDYHVTASLHDAPSPCKLKVGLIGPEYYVSQIVEIQPRSSKSIKFDVPRIKDGFYNLFAEGISGIEFKNSSRLNYAGEHLSIFIQTDKEIYKPGDEVQFRVIVVDKNMLPVNLDTISVQIFDGDHNRITQFQGPTLIKSTTMNRMQLSESPVLGTWSIEVNADDTFKTKNFKVEKYYRPKFEVQMETPKNVVLADGKIGITVISKYTHGKQVKGKCTVSAKPSYYYYGEDPDLPSAEKTVQFDGKSFIELDILGDLQITKKNFIPQLTIMAVVEEDLTGLKHNATTTVNVHREKYQIESVNPPPNKYHPRRPVTFHLVVKNLDGTAVTDTENPLTLTFGPSNDRLEEDSDAVTTIGPPSRTTTLTTYLDNTGTANFEVTLSDGGSNPYSVKAMYLDSTSYVTSLTKVHKANSDKHLKITVQTKNPTLGKDISIKVANGKFIPYFVYTIIGRGDILQSKIVKFRKNRKYHFFKITPTIEMFPRFTLFIHYVVGSDFHHSEEVIEIEKDFENSIYIDIPTMVKPGEEIKIVVNTTPDSYIGVLGVDQRVFEQKNGIGLNKESIFQDLSRYDARTPWSFGYGLYPGRQAGIVTLTNANFQFSRNVPNDLTGIWDAEVATMETESELTTLKEVPDTWIWVDDTNKNGTGKPIVTKVPDTITSWYISLVSLNSKTGLALTEKPKKVTVFKPFLVTSSLPYSIKKGEVISIPVEISNNFEDALEVNVTLDNSENEFDFTDANSNATEDETSLNSDQIRTITVLPNSSVILDFKIQPKKHGPLALNITAVSTLAEESICQELKVEPEGVTIFVNKAILLNLVEYNEKMAHFDIQLPSNAVPGSEVIELSVVGNLMGLIVENFDKRESLPDGSAEENMVDFVTNILMLNYLKKMHQTYDQNLGEKEEKAIKFLQLGYQRELQFKHDDGSYSAFGKSDPSGSTWLTAFVIRSFLQALPYIDIDPKVIESGLAFLDKKQTASGEFREDGKIMNSLKKEHSLGLTSFVLLTFAENKEYSKQYQDTIEKGLEFLENERANVQDGYSLALALNAFLATFRLKQCESVIQRIVNAYEKANDDQQWWTRSMQTEQTSYELSAVDVEMTGYMVIAYLFKGSPQLVLPNIRWLLSQQHENGRFSSGQGTVVALDALIKFTEKSITTESSMEIEYSNGDDLVGTIGVKQDELNAAFKVDTNELPKTLHHIQLTAKGNGSALARLSYRYNVAEFDFEQRFNITSVLKESLKDQLALEVCVSFIPKGDLKESSMAVLEISLPSGHIADADSFELIKDVHGVQRVAMKKAESVVIVYFYNLNAKQRCVPISAIKSHEVGNLKPTWILAYDFYDNEKRAIEFYSLES